MSTYTFLLPSSAADPAPVPVVEGSDHVAEALDRLVEQWRKPNIQALVAAVVGPCQALEDALQDLLTLRSPLTATDNALDVIGRLVGQPRNGVTDDDEYRRYVLGRISTNRSRGTYEELIRITRLVALPEYSAGIGVAIRQEGTAAVVVALTNTDAITMTQAAADILLSFLREAKKAGVRLLLEYALRAPEDLFAFDGPTDGGGFGDSTNPTTGGHFAGASE